MKQKAVPQPAAPVSSAAASAPASASVSGLPPMLRILLGLAAAVVVLAGLHSASEVAGPLLLGAVIVIICHPVRHPLERWGWPSWAATTGVIVLAYLILAALAAMLTYAGIQFTRLATDSARQLGDTADAVLVWLQSVGIEQQVADAASSLLQPSTIASFAATLGSSVLSVVTAFFFVLAYVVFMAADGSRYARAEATFGVRVRPTMQRFRAFNHGVRTYYVVNASFGAVVAVIDGLALWALQVPAPIVWAVLAFVTNFVPNIGFVLGLVPPALLALVVGGWPLMLVVIAVYCVVNVTLQVMVQPKFVSDAVDLSLTLSFFSVIFWTFIIGPLGAILSIPLTLLVRALVLESDPSTGWMRWLSGDREAVPVPVPRPEPAPAPAVGTPPPRRRRRGFSRR